jgi:uncharacterized membrane protein (DUF2068 family)
MPGRHIVLLIAIFKLFKAVLLILAAVAALSLMRPDVGDRVREWATDLDVGPYRRRIGEFVVVRVLGLNVKTLLLVAIGAGIYATLFLTEGLGLLFDKVWAEWMVVITSAGLIPFELMEIFRNSTFKGALPALVTFVLNVAIVVYLFLRVRKRMAEIMARRRAEKQATSPTGT